MDTSFYQCRWVGARAERFAHDPHGDAGGVAAAQEMVTQPGGCPLRLEAAQPRQPSLGDRAGPGERARGAEHSDRRIDEPRGDPALPQLRAQAGRPVPARRACLHPVPSEGGVVEMTASHEVGRDLGSHLRCRAAATQPPGQLGARPGPARKQVGGDEPRAASVHRDGGPSHGRPKPYLRAKGLGGVSGFFADSPVGPWASKVNSPVEKMPRTFRSKSSGLEALSFAVS